MRVCFSEGYHAPLPEGHRFPMGKFVALHRLLVDEGLVRAGEVIEPDEASWGDLATVHDACFLESLRSGRMERRAERVIGLPCTAAIVRRSRLATQGTLLAGRQALRDGIAANLAGGMHHAFPDRGEGFCVLNDVAVAVRVLRRDKDVRRVLLADLDVHQGNGTAAIFSGDDETFTFSMHGARNYPFRKATSDLDVALPDGTTDDAYMDALAPALRDAIERSRPDFIFYLAGVDPAAGDRFGKLALTEAGLARRDRYVLEAARNRGLPIALVLSGGYAATPEDTARLHAIAHREAARVFGNGRGSGPDARQVER